jgi:hypothetical protein
LRVTFLAYDILRPAHLTSPLNCYRRIAKLIGLQVQLFAALITIDAVTDAIGITMYHTTSSAADRCTSRVGETGILGAEAGTENQQCCHYQ